MESFCPDHSDTLKALVAFKLTNPSKSWREAENWYQWSFAKILYPKATVSSVRISEFHAHIGNENYYQSFFTSYLQMISSNKNIFGKISVGTLIDSTSLDNYIKTHLTAISNHNEVVKNEIRLIYILDRESKLPLYFRYVPANTIDNSILTTTINELRAFGIDVDLIIMDAGYCSKQNIEQLSKQNINFITRMTRNRKEYKSLMSEHGNDMQRPENAIRYHERFLFGKKVPITLYGAELNAYIMLDLNEYTKDMQNGTANYLEVKDDPLAIQKAHDSYFSAGKFILLSSNDYSIDEILPMYYTRQAIEQVFDIAKTYIGDTPLRVHSEDTLRGVLLIAFIATALNSSLSRGLYGSKYSTNTALSLLHNAIIKIFESMISVNELTKQQREIFSQLNIECPYTVLEKNNPLQKSPLLPSVEKEKGNRGRPKGSKNKPKHTFAADIESKQIMTSERQRGRPKGSKNKAKQANGLETSQNIEERRQRGRSKGSKNKVK
jgi:hypothetical protein